jgi:hypothetical protein
MKYEIPDKVYNLLEQHYQIIDHLSFLEFDHDFNLLKKRLAKIQNKELSPNDRIIIEHQDTDYYLEQCTVGINLRNFFLVLEELDIPRYIFIFYTNHFGISKEIDSLCQFCHPKDRPTVIESFLTKLHYDREKIKNIESNFDQITHHALCMMNAKRSHRNAMYHALKDIPADTLALNVTIPQNHINADQ